MLKPQSEYSPETCPACHGSGMESYYHVCSLCGGSKVVCHDDAQAYREQQERLRRPRVEVTPGRTAEEMLR